MTTKTKNVPINFKNMSVLRNIITQKGWEIDSLNRLKPSQETLNKLGITINHWNKILNDEVDLTIKQAKAISEWLDIPLIQLIKVEIDEQIKS